VLNLRSILSQFFAFTGCATLKGSETNAILRVTDFGFMVKFRQRYQMRHGKSRDEDARWGFNSAISNF